ncbi:hypothetical protein QYE76_027434 [Lolium multiflorum]|uniref:Uncharacterized protein n=1 Tax=Lolium multiflorum TaxID=4521 RepID=A0AAD8QKC6_LOLMU|nr:hypothetical protein QYE76_027434 [Lolium multiflorum]
MYEIKQGADREVVGQTGGDLALVRAGGTNFQLEFEDVTDNVVTTVSEGRNANSDMVQEVIQTELTNAECDQPEGKIAAGKLPTTAQRRLAIAEADERAMAASRENFHQDVNENAFFAQ